MNFLLVVLQMIKNYQATQVCKKQNGVLGCTSQKLVSCPDPTQLMRGEGVWCHKSNSLQKQVCYFSKVFCYCNSV